jgi:hypothetical protein
MNSSRYRRSSTCVPPGITAAATFTPWLVLLLLVSPSEAFMEMPKFSQLRLLYPGYPQYGGHYSSEKLMEFIIGPESNSTGLRHAQHSTAAVRMSWTLNRYAGRHAIGTEPIYLSHVGRDSFTGRDGQQYIHRNTAFGPFLAARYGNPIVCWGAAAGGQQRTESRAEPKTLTAPLVGRQGIVRVVSYRRQHEDGHVGLWDCSRFHQSRDWTNETHVIAVEFWEAADSYCPPDVGVPVLASHMEPIKNQSVQMVPRRSLSLSPYLHERVDDRTLHKSHKKERDKIWLQ